MLNPISLFLTLVFNLLQSHASLNEIRIFFSPVHCIFTPGPITERCIFETLVQVVLRSYSNVQSEANVVTSPKMAGNQTAGRGAF